MDEPVARDIGADAVCEPEHRISTDKSARIPFCWGEMGAPVVVRVHSLVASRQFTPLEQSPECVGHSPPYSVSPRAAVSTADVGCVARHASP